MCSTPFTVAARLASVRGTHDNDGTERPFSRPQHPYTELLFTSSPNPDPAARKLHLVKAGESPSYGVRPTGCPFHTRCPYREPRCTVEEPEMVEGGTEDGESHLVACHLHRQLSLRTFTD